VLKTFPKGGVHPEENKFSEGKPIEALPIPKIASIPLAQHLGTPAAPLVKPGDKVKVGQLIAKSEGFISANIHSSVSGTVKKIDQIPDASGYKKGAVIIEVEGDDWMEDIDRTDTIVADIKHTKEEIIQKIADAGIVGLGGATFPTHVKLNIPKGKKAELIIINAVECEPYLTCDHQLMLEKGEEIIIGVQLLMKALDVSKALIGIENNKPDAIENLQNIAERYQGIEVCALEVKYPQGGEKQLVKALINKEVPSGGIPIDVGVVAFNIGSVYATYEAVQKNKPLFERVLTITGKSVRYPANYLVRIGTPISEVIEATGGMPDDTGKVINGGPMMGRAINSVDIPVIKGSSGILLMPEDESGRKPAGPCIRCGKCVSVCPQGLEPYLLMAMAERSIFDKLEKANVTDCMECGSCSFTCPSNRPILDYIRFGKTSVIKIIRSRKK
jgi:Na+-translocating ferredoxin:NAD+ oxidoreductase subunit C